MNLVKNAKEYYILKKSELFDENWFKSTYDLPDNINPIKYYLKNSNLNPTSFFDSEWYLKEYKDVKNSGINPFVHYIKHGLNEHRLTKELLIKNDDKFTLCNYDYTPCFFKNYKKLNETEVNIAFFIKNGLENLLPTEYVRLIIPFYHLFLEKNFNPYIFHDDDFDEIQINEFKKFDIIVVQRDALSKKTSNMLINICKINEIKLIYEIDDNLLEIDKNHPDYKEFIEKKEVIKKLIINSDIVTVSTQQLKESFSKYNSNIKIIRNSLNDMLKLKNNNIKRKNIIKIGYMGTLTHKNDVKIIEEAMINVKQYFSKKGKNIVFETVGVSDERILNSNPINIPNKYSRYPYFIRWLKRIIDWDVALAPLENTPINDSKSEIKYLEYASLNIPGIYSNIGAYGKVIKNYYNGILINNNSSKEWESAIINLIEDQTLREKIIKNSNKDLNDNYPISYAVTSWKNIINELLKDNKKEIFNKKSLKLLLNPAFAKDYQEIVESELFDENFYPKNNDDSIYDFLTNGVFENYYPFKGFKTQEYIEKNKLNITKINPLVHFINQFVDKFKFNKLSGENITAIKEQIEKKISIIIPIYNAYEETVKCIESVLEYSTKNYELILINDASTDQRIGNLLKEYENNSKIKVMHNLINKGFVASVNIGLKNTPHDIILLNSDTIVTPKWLEKLTFAAYSNEKIGTVTPFSNNAGVFSVPEMNKGNPVPDSLTNNEVANIVEKTSNHEYMRVPTGNGFCMYIKRKTIDSVGYFDEKTFGKGYGEENDFCMRAIEKGWLNIIDDSTYIFHEGESSFSEEKTKLIKRNMDSLIEKHPNYIYEVNKFINSKRLQRMQKNIKFSLNGNVKRRILYIDNFQNIETKLDNETFLLDTDKLILYYYDNDLIKIKKWDSGNAEDILCNIYINLNIDEIIS